MHSLTSVVWGTMTMPRTSSRTTGLNYFTRAHLPSFSECCQSQQRKMSFIGPFISNQHWLINEGTCRPRWWTMLAAWCSLQQLYPKKARGVEGIQLGNQYFDRLKGYYPQQGCINYPRNIFLTFIPTPTTCFPHTHLRAESFSSHSKKHSYRDHPHL